MDSYLKNYINGQWVDSIGGKRHQVISPSTEEACTEIVLGTKADVDAAVSDWPPMLDALRRAARDLERNPPPVAPHPVVPTSWC